VLHVEPLGRNPDYLVVQVGETVTWWNIDVSGDDHSTHSFTYSWNSGAIPYLDGVYLTLIKTGQFAYRDDYTGATALLVVTPAVVQPPLPLLTNSVRLSDGSFQCTVTNILIGKTSIVEASTNLVDWVGVSTNTPSADSYEFIDGDAATLGRRFYRVLAMP